MLNQAFIQDHFNPEEIPFRTLSNMSETVLQTMLPDLLIYMKVCFEHILHILRHLLYSAYFAYIDYKFPYTAKDGDASVEFYWIDPMLCAERIAAKSKFSRHMYFQYEPEWSWERLTNTAYHFSVFSMPTSYIIEDGLTIQYIVSKFTLIVHIRHISVNTPYSTNYAYCVYFADLINIPSLRNSVEYS
jgi:hypothetical protein